MKYSECTVIKDVANKGWLIELENGIKKVLMTSTDFTIESVINMINHNNMNNNENFTVSNISVAEFIIDTKQSFNIYQSDGRKIDQDFNVVI